MTQATSARLGLALGLVWLSIDALAHCMCVCMCVQNIVWKEGKKVSALQASARVASGSVII